MSNNNSISTQPITTTKKGRKPKVTQPDAPVLVNDTIPPKKSRSKATPIVSATAPPPPTLINDIVASTQPILINDIVSPPLPPQPPVVSTINNAQVKIEFEKLLEMKKPDDPFDCLVNITNDKRCDETKIKKDSLLFRPARMVVLSENHLMGASVRNQDLFKSNIDSDWSLGTALIGRQCWSPDQYTKIEKITITQIAHKLKEEVGDCICKIEFTKESDTATMTSLIHEGSKLILSLNCTDAEKDKMFTKLYERSKKGDIRIMRGYIIRSADLHMEQNDTGMVRFLDADLLAQNKMAERLINVRNIISLTFKLTKYQLK